MNGLKEFAEEAMSQWNPRRSRGARYRRADIQLCSCSLSGTPAEAGVRGRINRNADAFEAVSVEPPPKQGCETAL